MEVTPKRLYIVLAFFSIYVIWGSTYMFNKIAVTELPPFFIAGIRFVAASLLVFLISKIMGMSIAITTNVAVWALKYMDSGLVALEISAQPLVVLIMMLILQGKKIKTMSMIGVVLGVIGIYLLVSQKQIVSDSQSIIGIVMVFTCMISWGYGSLFVAKADLPKNFFINTGYQMFTGGILLMLGSLLFGETWTSPLVWTSKVQWSILFLIVFGSIVAFTSFNYLLKVVSPEKVATSTYVNPIIAMLLGWYFLKEQISTQSIIAAIVLLTGVYFINTKKEFSILSKSSK